MSRYNLRQSHAKQGQCMLNKVSSPRWGSLDLRCRPNWWEYDVGLNICIAKC